MELSQIRYFLAVAETLNFSAAAKTCAVSQPALSKAISKLEDSLGARLFDRNTQQVQLTEFGRTMRIHFERIEENRRKALDAAKVASVSGMEKLDVGVMCTIGPHRFSTFLKAFCTNHPYIEIILHDVTAGAISELLLSGSLDCVFCARAAQHDQRFQVVSLFEENMVVAFADNHHFNQRGKVTLSDVALNSYLDRLHCEFRDDFLALTKASGITLDVKFRSQREDWILALVESGAGVSVMPQSSALLNNVAYRNISDLAAIRKLELVMTESATVSPALKAFHDAAQDFDWVP